MTRAATAEPAWVGLLWTGVVFVVIAAWFLLLFVALQDLLARPDVGRAAKACWVVVLVLLPVLGMLAYLLTRGRGTDRREPG
ncbi:MAG TPA: PLDc N-terminal domain-containing protein [Pseudonocardia sp.]|uniref:PLDc N-terminal domain-containing protein n=1 Tax=Pseudonocardia sp. TaxID=60912 RepID=UPI002B4B2D02|nr:PLDc N-terminal domain-containing protein [Pseudonocardia sp.]HLU58088.1 PLDc N-terminal domain-containing protein [Pseudonocardia sp.]